MGQVAIIKFFSINLQKSQPIQRNPFFKLPTLYLTCHTNIGKHCFPFCGQRQHTLTNLTCLLWVVGFVLFFCLCYTRNGKHYNEKKNHIPKARFLLLPLDNINTSKKEDRANHRINQENKCMIPPQQVFVMP